MHRKTWILCGIVLAMAGCSSETKTETTAETKPADPGTTTQTSEAKPADTSAKVADAPEYKQEDVKVGTGRVAEKGDIAYLTYTGKLLDGTQFDSNATDNKPPLAVTVGGGVVIEGFDKGIEGLKVGGERKITIPSKMGYKEAGSPPAVPPNAGLVFDVKLLEVVKQGQENEYTKKIVKEGSGPGAKAGDMISVHYTGTFPNGVQFDSSRGKQPLTFPLGQGQVIKGWDAGLVGMKKGERRILSIGPIIAYGAQGSPPAIPGNMMLLFDVECVEIKSGG